VKALRTGFVPSVVVVLHGACVQLCSVVLPLACVSLRPFLILFYPNLHCTSHNHVSCCMPFSCALRAVRSVLFLMQ
jgi:hypothetical protein